MAINPRYERPPGGGPMAFDEYLELERRYPYARYEYLNGVARLMAGGSVGHDRISRNVSYAIDLHFRSGPCTVFGSEVKVLIGTRTDGSEHRVYPDVTVSCDVADRALNNTLIRSPRIVVEVLSSSTEHTDRGEKRQAYQECPTIQEYILVSQFAPHVELYRRDHEDGTTWSKTVYGPGETVELRSVDVLIGMDEIYHNIDFAEFAEIEE